jgi:acetoin utilization deacetylase AcuC-like enzyme/acyl-CoA hydrolase/RimJ/RimL family protein N-acetyltransferase
LKRSWRRQYAEKLVTANEALSHIRNGQTIIIGSGAGEPLLLTQTLAETGRRFCDIEVIHLTSARGDSPLASRELADSFRYNTFFIGRHGARSTDGVFTDFTPMNLSELPAAMAGGVIVVDVALVQVSPPDPLGLCSLGVSVDATKAAVENAKIVIAQVNEQMPITVGDTMVPADAIDYMVEGNAPLIEVAPPELDPISLTIGRHVASLIGDGTTLHFDRGPISAATMRYLDTRKDLGIHTDILTDDLLRLIESGAVTNRKKRINRGKSVATMAMGSRRLYDRLVGTPYIELLPIDQVNSPRIISLNDNAVAVLSVEEMELTGLARSDTEDVLVNRSLLSTIDFINGTRESKDGFTIMALPSTTPDGSGSRIVSVSVGRGVASNRAAVDYVVTEYGIVNLYGLTVRERAIALISIAHPKFRRSLLEEAKRLGYVEQSYVIPPEKGCVFPHQYQFSHRFAGGTEIQFRPIQPSDARRLQRMFYALSPETVRMRFHGTIKSLTYEMAQRSAAIDYSRDMAIVGLVGPRSNPEIIAEGRYTYDPAANMGEFDIVVREDYRGRGIGTLLANYLGKIAYARGLDGVYADVIPENAQSIALLKKAWPTAVRTYSPGSCVFTVRFPEEEVKRPKDSIIVYSGRYADYTYGDEHPFNPGRARVALNLIRQQGYLNEPWMRVEEPRPITKQRLIESHSPAYIDALEEANSGEWKDEFARFNLGVEDCPVFRGVFDYVLLYTSATLTGVDLITNENANVVFNPLGGFHHASRSHAEGFCYVNDAVAAIDLLVARGHRVAYVDIDAHHGNGVQDAYYRDDRVITVSLHQTGKTLYPWSGFETEIGEGNGEGFCVNIPLPEETDDEAYERIFERIVIPAVRAFGPTVVVSVIGADTHRSDPLANLKLTNNGMEAVMKHIREFCSHVLLLGGGGYELKSTTRAWCRMWAAANRIDSLPDFMVGMGGTFLGGEGVMGADIVDMNYRVTGEKKSAIMKELDRIAVFHEKHTFPTMKRALEARSHSAGTPAQDASGTEPGQKPLST